MVAGNGTFNVSDLEGMINAFSQLRESTKVANRESVSHEAGYRISRPQTRFDRKHHDIGWMGTGPDWHYKHEIPFIRAIEIARDLERDDPVVDQGIRKLVANVLMNGTGIEPNTGDKSLDDDIKAAWEDYADDKDRCDYYQEMNVDEMEQMVLRRVVVDGDIWPAWTRDGSIQMLEAHEIRTPRRNPIAPTRRNKIVNGVEKSATNRRKLRIYVTRGDPNPFRQVDPATARGINIRDRQGRTIISHCYEPRRMRQSRGFTCLNTSFDLAKRHDDLHFAHLIQAQAVSCWALVRRLAINPKPDPPAGLPPVETTPYGAAIEGMQPGLQIVLGEGETMDGFSPNIPNPEFFPHVNLVLALIAINLDLPLVCLMLDASMTNFSGFRGALDQARLRFRQIQKRVGRSYRGFHYTRWLDARADVDAALRRARRRRDINLLRYELIPPVWPYLEPVKDVEADIKQLRNGLISPRRLQKQRGRRLEQIRRETIEDNTESIRMAKQAAQEVNDEFPDDPNPVSWRDMLNMSPPEGSQISMSASTVADTSDQPMSAENQGETADDS